MGKLTVDEKYQELIKWYSNKPMRRKFSLQQKRYFAEAMLFIKIFKPLPQEKRNRVIDKTIKETYKAMLKYKEERGHG